MLNVNRVMSKEKDIVLGDYCGHCLSKPCKCPVNSILHSVSNRYEVSAIKLADWESVAIGDTKTNKVICHFITENGFDEAVDIAKKITKFLNGC